MSKWSAFSENFFSYFPIEVNSQFGRKLSKNLSFTGRPQERQNRTPCLKISLEIVPFAIRRNGEQFVRVSGRNFQ